MTDPPRSALPFRLLDLPVVVLRHLAKSIPGQDLKVLRLTCKVLHFHATPVLFRTVVLTPHEPHFRHVLDVLGQHDGGRLATSVRTLKFDCRYPADVSAPCFWNRSHLHRFHYDTYVLKRNVGVQRAHLEFLLGQFCQILDGVKFPHLEQVVICGRGSDGQQPQPNQSTSFRDVNDNWKDHEPSFYAYRFRELTGRTIDWSTRWTLESSRSRSQFYTTCLLLSIWATGRRVKSVVIDDERLPKLTNLDELLMGAGRAGGNTVANDFVSALRTMGFLPSDDSERPDSGHAHLDQVARVEQMLTDVLVQ